MLECGSETGTWIHVVWNEGESCALHTDVCCCLVVSRSGGECGAQNPRPSDFCLHFLLSVGPYLHLNLESLPSQHPLCL